MKIALILLFAIAAIGGTVTIVSGYRWFKKYKLDYLSSYFLYLVFFVAFGFFGYIVQVMTWEILSGQTPPSPSINTLTLFLDLAAGPLLIIALYFLIRFAWEFIGVQTSRVFTVVYFSFYSLFMAFTIIIYFGIIKTKPPFPLGAVIGLITLYVTLLPVFTRLKVVETRELKQTATLITSMYLIFFTIYFGVTFFIKYHYAIAYSYFAFHFLLNLLPLFSLRWRVVHVHSKQKSQFQDRNLLQRIMVEHGLSKREQEILGLLLQGKSNADIEGELYISIHTVKNHVSKVYQKFGVKNRLQLTNLLRTLTSL